MYTGETQKYKRIPYKLIQCEMAEDPRSYDDTDLVALCVREHRHYTFANDLDFDFDLDDDELEKEIKELSKKYHLFEIDMYEHSTVHFSLSGGGMQCRFDTSSDVWFIAISKEHRPEEKEAEEIARNSLEEYSNYCNGFVYEWVVKYSEVGAGEDEYFWPYYSNSAWEDAEKECINSIECFLKEYKEFKVEAEVKVKISKTVYAKNTQEAKEILENECLPSWYIENSYEFVSAKKII